MNPGARLTKAAAVALVLGVGVVRPCLADDLPLNSLSNVAVYGFTFCPACSGPFQIQLQGPGSINGNVGLGSGAQLTLGGPDANISGKVLYEYGLITSGSGDNFNASGGPIYINGQPACDSDATCSDASRVEDHSPLLSSAFFETYNLYRITGGSVGSPTGTLNSSFTWTGNGGRNSARLDAIDLSTGDVLTLNGTASDIFIFLITGAMTGSSNGRIVLGPEVNPDHVLFTMICDPNVITCDPDQIVQGTGEPVSFSDSFAGAGIVLALDRDITLTSDNPWVGRYISAHKRTIRIEGTLTMPGFAVTPEPTTVALVATGLLGLAAAGRRRPRRRREGNASAESRTTG